jgi:hypothetical protein
MDVPHCLGDVACNHRVGLAVSAVDRDPATLPAHDHGFVSPKRAMPAATIGRRDRSRARFCAASIHFGVKRHKIA